MEITTIGLDLAKSIFQVHGVDATGGLAPQDQRGHEYKWNGSSWRFQGHGCRRAAAIDQIGLEGDEFGRQGRCALGMTVEYR
jgi:hypothetical protein